MGITLTVLCDNLIRDVSSTIFRAYLSRQGNWEIFLDVVRIEKPIDHLVIICRILILENALRVDNFNEPIVASFSEGNDIL